MVITAERNIHVGLLSLWSHCVEAVWPAL